MGEMVGPEGRVWGAWCCRGWDLVCDVACMLRDALWGWTGGTQQAWVGTQTPKTAMAAEGVGGRGVI